MDEERFSNLHEEIMSIQGKFCKEMTQYVKDLIGMDKHVVLNQPVKSYGDYVEITELACGLLGKTPILMAKCANGWCDKPIQPYFAHYDQWVDIGYQLFYERRAATIVDGNPLAGEKLVLCV